MAEATEDRAACELCGGSGWVLADEGGVELVRRCECAEEAVRNRLLDRAGIPERYRHCTLDSFELWNSEDPTLAKAQRSVQEFVDLYPSVEKGLLIMGPVGTSAFSMVCKTCRSNGASPSDLRWNSVKSVPSKEC